MTTSPSLREYIPFARVLTAINAVITCGMKPIVMVARIRGDDQTELLKKQIEALDVEIVQQPVVPFSGRSQQLPKERLFSFPIEGMKQIGCISVLSPTVGPDSKLYACCASDFAALSKSSLCLADLRTERIDQVLLSHVRDVVLDSLYLWGPKFLYDVVKENSPSLVSEFKQRYYGYCHLCYDILTRKAIVAFLYNFLATSEHRKRIAIAKVVKHEKIKRTPNLAREWYETVIEREIE